MNDDALSAIWISDPPVNKEAVMNAMNAVLEEDRVDRDKGRAIRVVSVLVLALLCPVLVWCATYGVSPLVRGGYALMAVGAALLVAAEWTYLTWFRQGLPGPADARSQLQTSAFLLARQVSLMRMVALWCMPVSLGAGLIGLWLYRHVSATGGSLLWAVVVTAWIVMTVCGRSQGRSLEARRLRMEQLLSDLE
jgi:hypothetical protein